jgi:hypothetical protein
MWREGVGMSFTYRLKSTRKTIPPWATPARIPRHEDVAYWKDVWNVRQSRCEDMLFTRQDGKIRVVSLKTRPLTHTVSKALATYKKIGQVSCRQFLLTLSITRTSCIVVIWLGQIPNFSLRSNPRSFNSRRTLASRMFPKSLPTATSRLMGL